MKKNGNFLFVKNLIFHLEQVLSTIFNLKLGRIFILLLFDSWFFYLFCDIIYFFSIQFSTEIHLFEPIEY